MNVITRGDFFVVGEAEQCLSNLAFYMDDLGRGKLLPGITWVELFSKYSFLFVRLRKDFSWLTWYLFILATFETRKELLKKATVGYLNFLPYTV